MTKPLLLVSNDDGLSSPGIAALAEALEPLGDVWVVAPDREQSATSHSITLGRPLRLKRHAERRYAVDGTPADAVYVALHHPTLLPTRPSLVVSGINRGLNLGNDVFYSGTVAAAREGALRGVPALAVSLGRGGDRAVAGRIARAVAEKMLADLPALGLKPTPLLNVNVPAGTVKGLKLARLGARLYDDAVEVRRDPRGGEYLWIGGPGGVKHEEEPDTDTFVFDAGWASLTPLALEMTDTARVRSLEGWAPALPAMQGK